MDNEARDIKLERDIDAYLKGNLSEQQVDRLWMRLLERPDYIALLQTEIDVQRIMQAKKKQRSAVIHYWKWIAAAAAVALLVISLNIFSDHSPKPINKWAETEIVLSDNLASSEVTRSAGDISTQDSLLNAGFRVAIEGNTLQAAIIYEDIIARYDNPDLIAKAQLNMGMLRYNDGSYEESAQRFNKAIAMSQQDELLKERGYWYLGNAFIQMDRLPEARSAVQQVYNLNQLYRDEAFGLLKRLDYELGYISFEEYKDQIDDAE